MPVCVLSDVTVRHLESKAKLCIFEKVHWPCIKCGISNLFIFYFGEYGKGCNIIQIQALCVVIPFSEQLFIIV